MAKHIHIHLHARAADRKVKDADDTYHYRVKLRKSDGSYSVKAIAIYGSGFQHREACNKAEAETGLKAVSAIREEAASGSPTFKLRDASEGGFFQRKNLGSYRGFELRSQEEPGKATQYYAGKPGGLTLGPRANLEALKVDIDREAAKAKDAEPLSESAQAKVRAAVELAQCRDPERRKQLAKTAGIQLNQAQEAVLAAKWASNKDSYTLTEKAEYTKLEAEHSDLTQKREDLGDMGRNLFSAEVARMKVLEARLKELRAKGLDAKDGMENEHASAIENDPEMVGRRAAKKYKTEQEFLSWMLKVGMASGEACVKAALKAYRAEKWK